MMKSFFKKLSLVMALAMVVSAMAPAATASAADALGIVAQGDTTWTVLETDVVEEIGAEVVDYQYKGAPANYKELDPTWDSSDKTVATVDKYGKVTTLKEGTTTISISLSNGQKGEVELTVKLPEVALTYEPVQLTHDTMSFVFNQNVSYAISDVTLTKMYGDYPINWPISFFECKDNVVKISTYVDFEDGDKYIVKFAGEEEGTEFVTTIGAVDKIEVSYKSTGKAAEETGVAYAPLDEDDAEIPVYLSYKLFANNVDVTGARKYEGGEIAYTFAVENDKADIDENELYFEDYTAGVAVLVPTFTYEVDGEDVTFTGEAFPVPATPVPAYGIDSFVAWTIVKAGDTKIDWANPVHKFPAFDDAKKDNEHYIAVLVKDTLGKYYVFPDEAVAGLKDGYKYGDKDVLLFSDIEDTNDDAADYRLEFKSTNDNTLFVGNDDGSITTIVDEKTSVLVSLYDTNDDDDEYLVRHLTALTVNVTAERKIDKVTATVGFDALPYVVNENGDSTGKVTFKVVDQYGDPIDVAASKLEIKTTYDKEGFTEKSFAASAIADKVGEFEILVDGADYTYTKKNATLVAGSVDYTVTVKDTNAKDKFTVKVEEPKYLADGTIKVEALKATASNIEQKLENSTKLGDLTKTIKVNELSNGLNVGVKNDKITLVTAGNSLLKDDKELVIKAADAEVGDVFVVVYGPNGKAVSSNVVKTATAGAYTFCAGVVEEKTGIASGASVEVMKYEATGDYTVKVYTVAKEYASKNSKLDVATTTFSVTNNNTAVTFNKQDVVDLTVDADGNTMDALTIEEIIKKAFSFKFGDKDLNETEAYFVVDASDYKYNEDSGRVFVYSVDIYVPLTNDAKDDVHYAAGTIKINKYVEVNGLEQ